MTHSIPDACAVAAAHRPRDDARHRRLQVRPDPGRRPARRHVAAGRARAGRACCCSAATRRTSTARATRRASRSSGRSLEERLRALRGPDRRHVASPRTSTASSRSSTPPPRSGARSRWSAARCARTSTSAARWATSTSPEGLLIQPREIEDFPDEKLVIISTGSQGEPLSALRRMAHRDHPQVELHEGDTVVFSATPIPGNERAVNETIDRLFHIGCDVITTRDAPIHASGHGYAEEIKLMLNLDRPRYVMPFHGDYKRIRLHGELAEAVGIEPDERLPGRQRPAAGDRRARRALRRPSEQSRDDLRRRRGHRRRGRRRAARPAHALRPTASSSSSRRSPSRTARRSPSPR